MRVPEIFFRRMILALLLFCPWRVGVAEQPLNSASLTNGLEALGGSARAMALGSAYVAITGDSSSIFWNPAGLAGMESGQIALHHNSWLQGQTQETLAGAFPAGGAGAFGFSASYLDDGVFQQRDSLGNLTGSYSANRLGLGLSWGKNWLPNLAFGLSAKGTLQDAAGTSTAIFSGDVGMTWTPVKNLSLGLAWMNWGTYSQGAPTAEVARAGISYLFSTAPSLRTLVAAAYAFQPFGSDSVEGGLEEVLHSFIALRAGYVLSLRDNQWGGLNGLTAGLGFQFNDFNLDYAYLPMGDLASTHRVSLAYSFGLGEKPSPTMTPFAQSSAYSGAATPTATPSPSVLGSAFTPTPTAEPEKLQIFFALPDSQTSVDAQANTQTAADIQAYLVRIRENSTDAGAWLGIGVKYAQTGQKQRALQCLEEALRLQPDNAKAKAWLKWIQSQVP